MNGAPPPEPGSDKCGTLPEQHDAKHNTHTIFSHRASFSFSDDVVIGHCFHFLDDVHIEYCFQFWIIS